MNDFNLFIQSKVNRGWRANAWRIAVLFGAAVVFVLFCAGLPR